MKIPIQIGPFRAYEPYFWKIIIHFINTQDAAIPFSYMQRKRAYLQWTPKGNGIKGSMTLVHSNRTIWSL